MTWALDGLKGFDPLARTAEQRLECAAFPDTIPIDITFEKLKMEPVRSRLGERLQDVDRRVAIVEKTSQRRGEIISHHQITWFDSQGFANPLPCPLTVTQRGQAFRA